MRPHRRQPTRLPSPWDSPGKNTGVCCHFLLQCMKVRSESEVAQLYPTLSDPTDGSPPGSSVHGIFQARVLEWGAIAFSPLLPRKQQKQYGRNDSIQFSRSLMSRSLRPHELQYARPPCPTPTPGAHPNSCPLSQ